MLPTWNPSLSVGNAELDAQIQTILTLCQELVASLERPSPDPDHLRQLLNTLIETACRHITAEEDLLVRNACPDFLAHQAVHDQELAMLAEFLYKGMRQTLEHTAITAFMTDWLLRHLCEMDLPSKDYLGTRSPFPASSANLASDR